MLDHVQKLLAAPELIDAVAQFLAWAARETGREVAYGSPAAEAEAVGIVVHGSIAGLTPAEALDAVLATTSVHAAISGGQLVVESRR